MSKTMVSSLFRCCMAVLVFAALNVLASFSLHAQSNSEAGGVLSAE